MERSPDDERSLAMIDHQVVSIVQWPGEHAYSAGFGLRRICPRLSNSAKAAPPGKTADGSEAENVNSTKRTWTPLNVSELGRVGVTTEGRVLGVEVGRGQCSEKSGMWRLRAVTLRRPSVSDPPSALLQTQPMP